MSLYGKSEVAQNWMVPALVALTTWARRIAFRLDADGTQDAHSKKLVELLRELFQTLHKEREKKSGCVWVVCELLRLYFKLGQVNQCPFLLKGMTQPYKNEFTQLDLPTPIAVTLFAYWG